jgi:hypothetical protein
MKGATKRPVCDEEEPTVPKAGLGVACPHAQADGVPCTELGRECEHCEKARDELSEQETPPTESW